MNIFTIFPLSFN